MKFSRHLRPQSAMALGLLCFLGCSTLGDRTGERPKATIESVFVESDHRLGACLHGDLAQSYLSDPDSVLFYDRDSKIRLTPPTKKRTAIRKSKPLSACPGRKKSSSPTRIITTT